MCEAVEDCKKELMEALFLDHLHIHLNFVSLVLVEVKLIKFG